MKGQPWYDGMNTVSQCGIEAGTNMTYFIPTDDQSGTFWWHAHVVEQRDDGVFGLLVIDYADPPAHLTYDEEIHLLVTDHFHSETRERVAALAQPVKDFPHFSIFWSDSVLINGVGVYNCSLTDDLPCDSDLGTIPEFNVTAGRKYLVRILNAGKRASQQIRFEGHSLTIVEADGVYTEPYEVDAVEIAVSQRYAAILTANQEPSNYWLHVQERFGRDNYAQGILHYEDPKVVLSEPTTSVEVMVELANEPPSRPRTVEVFDQLGQYLMEWDKGLKTYRALAREMAAPKYYDKLVRLSVAQGIFDEDGNAVAFWNKATGAPEYIVPEEEILESDEYILSFGFNDGVTFQDQNWKPGQGPLLFNAYLDDWEMSGGKPPLVFDCEEGDVVQVVLENGVSWRNPNNLISSQHPFHLHGHTFWIMGQGFGTYDPSLDSSFSYDQPLMRDTQMLYPNSWLALRFVCDNPGVWGFHCHISNHDWRGLRMAFNAIPSKIPPPPKDFNVCGPLDIQTLEKHLPKLLGTEAKIHEDGKNHAPFQSKKNTWIGQAQRRQRHGGY